MLPPALRSLSSACRAVSQVCTLPAPLGAAVVAVALMAVLFAVGSLGPSADATFPGTNGKIAYVKIPSGGGPGIIHVMDSDGSNPVDLGVQGAAPAWSPDGLKLAYVSGEDIWTMNANGTSQKQLTFNPAKDRSPSWSPDGSRIAFSSDRDSPGDIWIMNTDGSGLTPVTSSDQNSVALDPDWSPDGSKIVYRGGQAGNPLDIFVVDVGNHNATNLTQSSNADESDPAWSPDGSSIAYSNALYGAVFTMWADGRNKNQLTSGALHDQYPAWSPDGSKIAFQRQLNISAYEQIMVVSATGGSPVNLTNSSPGGDEQPNWQPIPLPPTDTPSPVPSASPTPSPTPSPSPTPMATPSPSPSPSGTPTPTPTTSATPIVTLTPTTTLTPIGQTPSPTPTPGPSASGNVDCVNGIDANDAVVALRVIAGDGAAPCPGNLDVNCNGGPDAGDVLDILLFAVHLPSLPTPSNCRAIGT
jgi:hypothetical protein